ncbi:formyltransferase family protein [Nostoc foliaceum]|uniref:Formyl transferase N-terminal domain-containing protein n=1 Tax=Nostoc foliaceum FACHB-393 TaxID=2692915 RepID=A0ABR8IGP9_9NOSO|nr:formyltransferase family protein [Nostoc foliaceum]MBD2650012.1 hypothetical protein [Nostoc foliaceum FACHB-393]
MIYKTITDHQPTTINTSTQQDIDNNILKPMVEATQGLGNCFNPTSSKVAEKILFIGDRSNWSDLANQFIQEVFSDVETIFWNRGEAYPSKLELWEGDRIFSFKSDLILPNYVLKKSQKSAINFHPAPPKYRGIGGYNYALYNGESMFGVTCHHMVEQVDFGRIIKVLYFPILNSEKASYLKLRAGAFCLTLMYEIIIQYILGKNNLPESQETWGEKLYTYKSLEKFINQFRSKKLWHHCIL